MDPRGPAALILLSNLNPKLSKLTLTPPAVTLLLHQDFILQQIRPFQKVTLDQNQPRHLQPTPAPRTQGHYGKDVG